MKRKLFSAAVAVVMTVSLILSTAFSAFGATTLATPKLTLKSFATKAVLSWNRNTNATGYQIYWCGGDTSSVPHNNSLSGCWNEHTKLVTISSNAKTTYTKTGLSYKKNYHFKVRAYKKSGSTVTFSNWSDIECTIDTENRLNAATRNSRSTYYIINTQGKKNVVSNHTLTSEEKTILSNFAKTHFKSDMTVADKVVYTAEWIRKNLYYGPIPTASHTKNIFVLKKGQCSDYNGAMVEMMIYLGFDARLIQGYRHGNTQHFWGEVIIDGSVFLMEVGETTWDSPEYNYKWRFLCNTYSEADGHYEKNGAAAKDSIASYPAEVTNFRVASRSDSVINLAWTQDNNVAGYYVYMQNNSTKAWQLLKKTDKVGTYRVANLNAGTQYSFAIKAYRTANGQEITSATFPVLKVTTKPANVTGFKVKAVSANAVKLVCNAVKGAQGYLIYEYDNAKSAWSRIEKTTNNNTTFLIKNLKPGREYKYAIKAYRIENKTALTSPSIAQTTTVTKLAKVTGIRSTSTQNAVHLAWDKVAGAKGYIVYDHQNGKWHRLATVTANSFTAKNITAGKSCWFAVRAYKNVGGQEIASVSFDTYKTSTNPARAEFTVNAGTRRAVVKWTKVAGATGHIVYFKTSANGKWQKLLDSTTDTQFVKAGLASGRTYYFTVKAYKNYNGMTFNGAFTTKAIKVK